MGKGKKLRGIVKEETVDCGFVRLLCGLIRGGKVRANCGSDASIDGGTDDGRSGTIIVQNFCSY